MASSTGLQKEDHTSLSKEQEDTVSCNINEYKGTDAVETCEKEGMSFDDTVHLIRQEKGADKISAIVRLRDFIQQKHSNVLSSGVVSDLVHCMNEEEEIQFEAAWALTNIASGTNDDTKAVVEGGAIPRFVQLIESPSDKVREQVIMGLGNIVVDSPQGRDLVFNYKIIKSLSNIVGNVHDSVIVRRQASWVFSNLCRHKALPLSDGIFNDMLPVFCEALEKEGDEICVGELCWGVFYITDSCSYERMQAILNSTIYQNIIDKLRKYDTRGIITPAVRAIGNLSACTDDQKQIIIDLGALPILYSLLNHKTETIRKEVCWTFSNIAAGTLEQKEAIKEEGVITKVIEFLNDGGESFKVKKESLWVLCNLCDEATYDMARYLVNQGALQSLCACLDDFYDVMCLQVAIEGLDNLLQLGERKKVEDGLPCNPFIISGLLSRERLKELSEILSGNGEFERRIELLTEMCFPRDVRKEEKEVD